MKPFRHSKIHSQAAAVRDRSCPPDTAVAAATVKSFERGTESGNGSFRAGCAGAARFLALSLALGFSAFPAHGEDSTKEVLAMDFTEEPDMSVWRNLYGRSPQVDGSWRVEEEDGYTFLRATPATGIFGVTIPLSEPIFVDSSIAQIEVEAKVRKTAGTPQRIGIALTNRSKPEGQQGGPFATRSGSDSGFKVIGYQYNNEANKLQWVIDGMARPHTEGKAFLFNGGAQWTEWHLVYDRAAGTLTLYANDLGTSSIIVEQTGVSLDGIELQSLWLDGSAGSAEHDYFIDYDDISVSVTPAQNPK